MSSGLPVHDDKKRRSDAQVAAVVTYDRPKANPIPFAIYKLLRVQMPGAIELVAVCLLLVELRANVARHHLEFRVAIDACRLRSSLIRVVLPRVLGFQFLSSWIKALLPSGRR